VQNADDEEKNGATDFKDWRIGAIVCSRSSDPNFDHRALAAAFHSFVRVTNAHLGKRGQQAAVKRRMKALDSRVTGHVLLFSIDCTSMRPEHQ
jgi:hypothetical protein